MLRWTVIGTLSVTLNVMAWGLFGGYLGKPAASRHRAPVELSMARLPPPPAPRPVPRTEPRMQPAPRPAPRECVTAPRPRPKRQVRPRPRPRLAARPTPRPAPKLDPPRPQALAALTPAPDGTEPLAPAAPAGLPTPAPRRVVAPTPRPVVTAPPARPAIDLAGLKGRIRAAIARHRHYPRQARRRGLEGTVLLAFRITPGGRITGIRVVRSAGALLDDAARDALRKAAPLPFYPDVVRIAVQYQLDD